THVITIASLQALTRRPARWQRTNKFRPRRSGLGALTHASSETLLGLAGLLAAAVLVSVNRSGGGVTPRALALARPALSPPPSPHPWSRLRPTAAWPAPPATSWPSPRWRSPPVSTGRPTQSWGALTAHTPGHQSRLRAGRPFTTTQQCGGPFGPGSTYCDTALTPTR